MSYVDSQSYVTDYWREIKDKPKFEQTANDKTLDWNNRSLKGRAIYYHTGEIFKKQIKIQQSQNLTESHLSIVVETVVNVHLNPSSCVISNERELTSSRNNCHVDVEIDSKIVLLLTYTEKLEKVLEINVVLNKDEICSKIKAIKTESSILTKQKHTLKLNR